MIAIDPGSEKSAWMLWDGEYIVDMAIEQNELLVDRMYGGGVFYLPGKEPMDCGPLVIEWIETFGMSVGKDTFETVYWVGRFAEAFGGEERITRRQVKMTLCGHLKANDTNIRQALIDRFGGDGGRQAAVGTKKAPGPLYGVKTHLWQALAVAITYQTLNQD